MFKIITISLFLVTVFFNNPCYAQPSRGIFVSMIEDNFPLTNKNQINALVDYAASAKMNFIFIQVYRANKSWFPTNMADDSLFKEVSRKHSFDPLEYLIQQAHAKKIEVHAWVNLLSLSTNFSAPLLKRYGVSILTRNTKPKSDLDDYKIDHQFFLEPGDPRVVHALTGMVHDLVARYKHLDGIQLDYIRYPDVHPEYGHTPYNLKRFTKETGIKSPDEHNQVWRQWKRDQVTSLVKQLTQKARTINPKIQVSTTGCVSFSRAFDEAFQDWPSWVNTNLVDFVTVMNYPSTQNEYQKNILDVQKRVNGFGKINFAVGAYKFLKTPQRFSEQWATCVEANPRGCVEFFYGNLEHNLMIKEFLLSEKSLK